MPTGYTHPVQNGTITEFPEFAMQCARAFGALVMMRDDPSDTPIPDEFTPSDYHKTAIDKARAGLLALDGMTPNECDAAAVVAFNEAVASRKKRELERTTEHARYIAMRSKVEKWKPPTPDHNGLRHFMLEQLNSSIEFDCSIYATDLPILQTGSEWLANKKDGAEKDILYHTKEHAKELERTATRNAWVKALRASLV
jgi:hypothetical protein